MSTRLRLISPKHWSSLLLCFAILLSPGTNAHPLDELGDAPYSPNQVVPADIAVSLEKEGTVRVGMHADAQALVRFEDETLGSLSDNAPMSQEQVNALLKNLDGLFALYDDDRVVELTLKTNLKAPYTKGSTAKKLWLEWQSPSVASAELLSLLVHPKLTMAKVGVIDTTNSGNSRLEHLAKSDEHIVRLKGEYVADAVIKAADERQKTSTVPKTPSTMEQLFAYGILGFEHIIPKGLDHIRFIIALCLWQLRVKELVVQASIFTVAHTTTLGLAIMGLVTIPGVFVEPLIALSIAWLAWSNIRNTSTRTHRGWVIFGFGLLHGLGFAGVLSELGLPEESFILSLLGFNLGVEVGQVAIILGIALLLGPLQNRQWYRKMVTIPFNGMLALVGLYWTFERVYSAMT